MSKIEPLPSIESVPLRFAQLPSFPVLVLALLPALFAEPTEGATLASWVELVGPGNEASIRVVTDSAACPVLISDGGQLRMQVRAEPGPLFSGGIDTKAPIFNVRTCEVTSTKGKTVLLDGKAPPMPRRDLQRVVVFWRYRVSNQAEKTRRLRYAGLQARMALREDCVARGGDQSGPCHPFG